MRYRLTDEQVLTARQMYANGESIAAIHRTFHWCSYPAIRNVIRGNPGVRRSHLNLVPDWRERLQASHELSVLARHTAEQHQFHQKRVNYQKAKLERLAEWARLIHDARNGGPSVNWSPKLMEYLGECVAFGIPEAQLAMVAGVSRARLHQVHTRHRCRVE